MKSVLFEGHAVTPEGALNKASREAASDELNEFVHGLDSDDQKLRMRYAALKSCLEAAGYDEECEIRVYVAAQINTDGDVYWSKDELLE